MTALTIDAGHGARGAGSGFAGPDLSEVAGAHLSDEPRLLGGLIERAVFSESERARINQVARRLVETARSSGAKRGGLDAFLQEYGLTSDEGVLLMCVAESLLRIPDVETADRLIAEKLGEGAWEGHLGRSDSLLVNASSFGLMLTGRLLRSVDADTTTALEALRRMVANSGESVIRQAVRQAVQILGGQFVLGRSIEAALERSKPLAKRGYLFSYDMLGEAARCEADARVYFERYLTAIGAVGEAAGGQVDPHPQAFVGRPGVSIKLSALHPRFEAGKDERLCRELLPRLLQLLKAAREAGLMVTLDVEEQDRLEPLLKMFARCASDPALAGWPGLGIAVQAYSKRAIPVLRWLRTLAHDTGRYIPVRLVKGAYWDSEIKWAQQRGLADYPVFTRKLHTDVSYLACVRLLLSDRKAFYPQFATHNAHSLAAAHVAASDAPHEFQRLYGMGDALYDQVAGSDTFKAPCRIYAPVGGHEDLLAYLVRRLLENGANSSFVHRLGDRNTPVEDIVADPVARAELELNSGQTAAKMPLPKPRDIHQPERRASAGLALTQDDVRATLIQEMADALSQPFAAGPIVGGERKLCCTEPRDVFSPHDYRAHLGSVEASTDDAIEEALSRSSRAAFEVARMPVDTRARALEAAADRIERDRARFMAIIIREAGRTIQAAHDEVRETVDFLRYYARQARCLAGEPLHLEGPTGETNTLRLEGRGPFAVICPWNFPLALLVGQAAAALAAGNPVLIKPAEQTPLTAMLAVETLLAAGFSSDAVQLLPGDGRVGEKLVRDRRVAGVAFTGSCATAWSIQSALAQRRSAIVPFIAETGGINAMIADSSALPEQVVSDCVRSAFESAGQRCSAARVLFLQDDIADRTLAMLTGAIAALDVGDPFDAATDVGPVIDQAAQDALDAHKLNMQRAGRLLIDPPVPEPCRAGTYVTPAAYEIERLDLLQEEVFGPILHVIRYSGGGLDDVIEAINGLGYGLTLGLHSRLSAVADRVAERARVGNLYVNRDQIGAVVGVQPFGGEGLSGTGPKAGGPYTLLRFMTERVRSTNITATGGNTDLLRQVGSARPVVDAET